MANIDIPEESKNNLGKTQVITEQIINDLKNGMSEELAKAGKKINDEIKNHLITTKNLIVANKKLGEQDEKISAQQTQITEQDEKISAQQTQIVVQNGKISAQQTQIGEHKEKISVQQKQIDKQDKELIEQKKMLNN